MKAAHNGGPAFPTANGGSPDDGMDLRDYFAAKFAGALVTPSPDDDWIDPLFKRISTGPTVAEKIAKISYQLADAMLKERAK